MCVYVLSIANGLRWFDCEAMDGSDQSESEIAWWCPYHHSFSDNTKTVYLFCYFVLFSFSNYSKDL